MRNLLHGLKSDESLMLAYQRGDSSAFESLYLRHKDSVFAFLYRNCQESALVEELAQDAWTSIIRRVESYQPTAKFRTYLFSVAHNKLVDHWRRNKNRVNDIDIDEIGSHQHAEQGSASDDYEPEASLAKHQQKQTLLGAMALLPNEQRDVFLLREEGFSQEQISEITGVGRETVKSRLRYAGQHLKTAMETQLINNGTVVSSAAISGARP